MERTDERDVEVIGGRGVGSRADKEESQGGVGWLEIEESIRM